MPALAISHGRARGSVWASRSVCIPVEGSSVISFRCGFCACELPTMQWDVLANGTIAFRFPPNTGIQPVHGGVHGAENPAAKRLVLGAGPDRCLCWFNGL